MNMRMNRGRRAKKNVRGRNLNIRMNRGRRAKKTVWNWKKKELFFLLFLLFLFLFVIQHGVQDDFAPMQYLDELFALLIVPAFLLRLGQRKIHLAPTKKQRWFGILLAVFWLTGWAGFFLHHYQPLSNTIKDSYVALKFFMSIGASFLIFEELEDFSWLERKLWPALNIITGSLFVLCILDLCFGLFYTETRFGQPAIKLFYSSYTALVAVCTLLCAIYMRLYEYFNKRILVPLGMLFFIFLNTKRVKALGIMVCIFFVYMFAFHRKKRLNRKVMIPAAIAVAIAVGSAAWQLFYYYYKIGTESARLVLTIVSPFIAMDHFPFGTGWGTYGSAFSVEPYSPVYKLYHIDGVWGISPGYHSFVSDTFWPMILGQCGVIGFIAYTAALVLLILAVLRFRKGNAGVFAAGLVSILYLLVSSSSESAFVSPWAVSFGFLLGFLFAEHEQWKKASGGEAAP